jgi:hypothetical protein
MDSKSIRDRLNYIREEIAQIRERNQHYLTTRPHSRLAQDLHGQREGRLVQIREELAALLKKKN